MAQDDYYYEIQLTNKQLVFYFMAGATGLILSFLAGVMVGRGVDAASGEVQASRPSAEERIVEETPVPVPPGEDLTYAKRLEGERVDESAARAKAPARSTGTAEASKTPATPPDASRRVAANAADTTSKPVAASGSKPAPTSVSKPAAPPAPAPATNAARLALGAAKPPTSVARPPAGEGTFTIQVGAFKDGASAESVVSRLKTKGFAAYVMSPSAEGGLFNVRVGTYQERGEAEKIQVRLRDQEKFKPFIVKQ